MRDELTHPLEKSLPNSAAVEGLEQMSAPTPVSSVSEPSSYRYFVTYSGVKLPLRLIDPLEESEIDSRNTFVRAGFDAAGRLTVFEQVVYGAVELCHRYRYDEQGVLRRAVVERDGEETSLEFDGAGSTGARAPRASSRVCSQTATSLRCAPRAAGGATIPREQPRAGDTPTSSNVAGFKRLPLSGS